MTLLSPDERADSLFNEKKKHKHRRDGGAACKRLSEVTVL